MKLMRYFKLYIVIPISGKEDNENNTENWVKLNTKVELQTIVADFASLSRDLEIDDKNLGNDEEYLEQTMRLERKDNLKRVRDCQVEVQMDWS